MNVEKITPRLLSLFQDFSSRGREAGSPRRSARLAPRAAFGGLSLARRGTAAETEAAVEAPRAKVFLRCGEDDALKEKLQAQGVRLHRDRGRVRTALMPLDKLEAVAGLAEVTRIAPSRFLRPMMDFAPGTVNLSAYRTAHAPGTGKGVLIGIIDTGIDAKHAAFDGRVLRIWDQTARGTGTGAWDYGKEHTSAARMASSKDKDGHGTHVAGIAAGGAGKYEGVAPAAKFLVVKTDFDNTHIADGVQYCFEVAARLGVPCVVNLSLGGHGDAHDGSDDLSQLINAETGPGRIVVCAAGNEGDIDMRAQVAKLERGNSASAGVFVPTKTEYVAVNGWYDGGRTLEVSVAPPTGPATPFQPVIGGGGADYQRTYATSGGSVRVSTPPPGVANGDHNVFVEFLGKPDGGLVRTGLWRIVFRAAAAAHGPVDLWLLDDADGFPATFRGAAVRNDSKIGSPGCAASAITVGAYACKNKWTASGGDAQSVGFPLERPAGFSSQGPLRGGAKKPDLVAPGAMIVSCRSRSAAYEDADQIDADHVIMAGSSMACPFVTGLVAAILSDAGNAKLDPDKLKTILRECCSHPGGTGWDNAWGYGLPDAAKL